MRLVEDVGLMEEEEGPGEEGGNGERAHDNNRKNVTLLFRAGPQRGARGEVCRSNAPDKGDRERTSRGDTKIIPVRGWAIR